MKTRNLIKNILKEESSDKLIKKGIDITINALKQEFPFVVGWTSTDSYDTYKVTIYIDLIIDYDKTQEYYGLELRKSEIGNRVFGREHYLNKSAAYPVSAFSYEGIVDPHDEYRKIGNYVSDMYEYIPDELKLKSRGTYSDDYKTLNIENFIFVDETTN